MKKCAVICNQVDKDHITEPSSSLFFQARLPWSGFVLYELSVVSMAGVLELRQQACRGGEDNTFADSAVRCLSYGREDGIEECWPVPICSKLPSNNSKHGYASYFRYCMHTQTIREIQFNEMDLISLN